MARLSIVSFHTRIIFIPIDHTWILSILMKEQVPITATLYAQLSQNRVLNQTRISHAGYLQAVKRIRVFCYMYTLLMFLLCINNNK